MRISLLFGQQVDDPSALLAHARRCAEQDLRLWVGQSMLLETHLALAAVAAAGVRIEVGLGVAPAPLRTAFDAFVQARSLAALTGRTVSAGYGLGSAASAAALRGGPVAAPARYLGDYLSELRTYRDGGRPVGSLQPPPLPAGRRVGPLELGCGVLRPAMARVAGATADFVITWLTPPAYLEQQLLPALRAGAAAAGRAVPRVVSVVQCGLRRPGRDPVALAVTAFGRHLGQPHYAAMLRTAGLPLDGDRAHDLRAALQAGLFAWGDVDDVAAVVAEHRRVGVDEVALTLGSTALVHGATAALDDADALLAALVPDTTALVGVGR